MSRGLGEVQIQVLEGFQKYHDWCESRGEKPEWLTLKRLKTYAWGDRRDVQMYPDFTLLQVRRNRSGKYKDNHHTSFKRALTLLVRGGFIQVGTVFGPDGMPVLQPGRIKPTLEYRLTEKGKCAVLELHT